MPGEICGTCRFFCIGTSIGFPGIDGMCRRHAPVGPAIGSGRWQVFPPMPAGHWCGEHVKLRGAALHARYDELQKLVADDGDAA